MTVVSKLASASAIAIAVCSLGVASEAKAEAEAAKPEVSSREVIVVTARRQAESLSKVPVSIIAVSGDELEAKAIRDVYDLSATVPGLSVVAQSGVNNQPNFNIRGRGLDYGAAAGSVETYFADVPLSGPFQQPAMGPQFFDLQNVQVLKGPQGTLFGRSTTGGAVLFVPAAPTDEVEGYLRLQFGNYNNRQYEGMLNVPIVPGKLDLRLAGFFWQRDGFGRTLASGDYAKIGAAAPLTDFLGNPIGEQTYDNQDTQQFRATLLWRPTENLTNSAVFMYNSTNVRSLAHAGVIDSTTFVGGILDFLYPNLLDLSARVTATDVPFDHRPTTTYGVINTTTLELNQDILVKNIFGYLHAAGVPNLANDADGTPLGVIDLPNPPRLSKTDQYTDELQLQGNLAGGRLEWLLGGLIDIQTTPSGGSRLNLHTSNQSYDTVWIRPQTDAYSGYASVKFKATERFTLSASARHSWVTVKQFVQQAMPAMATLGFSGNPDLTPDGAMAAGWTFSEPGASFRSKFEGTTYAFGFDYQANDDLLVYGGYRRGWKPGGFNTKPPLTIPSGASFGPETVDDFYVGLKSALNLGDISGRLNIEGYLDNYFDKQSFYLTLSSNGLAGVTSNIPKTHYRGVDVDLSLDLTDWLLLQANYSYTHARFAYWPDSTYDATAVLVPQPPNANLDLSINPVGTVSPHQFSITTKLHFDLPDEEGELVLAPTVNYKDGQYDSNNAFLLPQGNTAFLGLPVTYNTAARGGAYLNGYTMLNLRAAWNEIMGSRVSIGFNLINATNELYKLGSTKTLTFGVEAYAYGPPRTYSVDISAKF